MTESLAQWFTQMLSGVVPEEIIVFIVSMIPILELRGGILVAYALGIDWKLSYILCVLGNILPVPFILWFITPIFNWMKTTKLFAPLVNKIEARSMAKSANIQKYEMLGLLIFVAIPLPGTGAWTGSLIASLLNIPFKKAFPMVLLGVIIAGLIMTLLSFGIIENIIH